jgi:hypothetical protein
VPDRVRRLRPPAGLQEGQEVELAAVVGAVVSPAQRLNCIESQVIRSRLRLAWS